jgi:hypothetical protein
MIAKFSVMNDDEVHMKLSLMLEVLMYMSIVLHAKKKGPIPLNVQKVMM